MITTHVLDTSSGRPATGLRVVLELGGKSSEWQVVGHGETDGDGRLRTLVPNGAAVEPGVYRLIFDTRRYFDGRGVRVVFPTVIVTFEVAEGDERPHYHMPLLLSPFGYTTYRGS